MNICIFKGNLCRDCEIRFTASNVAVVKVGIAVNERVKVADKWQDKVHYFDVVAFGKRGETFAEHHHKGDPALLTCRASLNQWTDKDGGKRSKVEFILDDFEFIKPRGQRGSADGGEERQQQSRQRPDTRQTQQGREPEQPMDDHSIPF